MTRSRTLQGAVLAGWIGVLAGLKDSVAFFLHPVTPQNLPFAIFAYALVFVVTYLVVALIGRLVWPARAVPVAVGAVAAGLPLLFGTALIETSTDPFLRTAAGLAVGFGVTLLLATGIFLVVSSLLGRRGARPPGRGPAIALAVVMLIWPILWVASGDAIPRGATASGDAPRGFILVSLDAARGDHVSGHGYSRPTTPHLDELIADGLSFSRAYVQSSCSGPGHACMLTGLPSLTHGVLANADVLAPEVVTVAERLADEGFHTAAFLNNFYLEAGFGFDQGFGVFIDGYRATRTRGFATHPSLRTLSLYHLWRRLTHRPGERSDDSIDGALAWLRHRPDGDFFLFLHVMDPHSPYDPPADLRERFYRPAGPEVFDTDELRGRMAELTPSEVAGLRDLYDGDLALADRKLGRLVAELKRQGIFDSTLLVVTGDHGEVLYEKDDTFDHGLVWEGSLRVPLVFSYPARLEDSTVVHAPVASTALVPTAFALLELPYADQAGQGFFDPLWPVRLPPPSPVMTLTGVLPVVDFAAAVGPRYKVVSQEGEIVHFFDLDIDPTEQHDLWPEVSALPDGEEPKTLALDLADRIREWLVRSDQAAVVEGSIHDDRVDRHTEQRLRALGY